MKGLEKGGLQAAIENKAGDGKRDELKWKSVGVGGRNNSLAIVTIFQSWLYSSYLTISFVSRNVMNIIIIIMKIEKNNI